MRIRPIWVAASDEHLPLQRFHEKFNFAKSASQTLEYRGDTARPLRSGSITMLTQNRLDIVASIFALFNVCRIRCRRKRNCPDC